MLISLRKGSGMKSRSYQVQLFDKPGLAPLSSSEPVKTFDIQARAMRLATLKVKQLYGDKYRFKIRYMGKTQ